MGGPGLAAAFLCLLVASVAGAQDLDLSEGLEKVLEQGSIELSADYLEYERSRGLYSASGNVVLRQGRRTIRADWVSFNQETGVGVASGDVVVEEDGNVLRSSFIQFDLYGVRGVVRDGSFESSASHFKARGRVIEKTGADTYAFRDGVFTTCRCPDEEDTEPWVVTAEEAEIEVEGYAVVEDSTVEILGVPVVWLPWMIYPVMTKRTTGLLLPEMEYGSQNGAQVGFPVFLALHDQVNLTLTPGFSSRRGARGRGELEYVFGEESSGEVTGVYLHDVSHRSSGRRPGAPFRNDRFSVDGNKDFHLPGGFRFKSHFDVVSDNQVPLEFDEVRQRRADRRLIAQGFLERGFGASERFGAALNARFADDMQNPDDRDRDDTMLQRLPGGRVSVLPGGVPWLPRLVASMDVDYANFWQDHEPGRLLDMHRPPGRDFLDVGVDGVANEDERSPDPGAPLTDPHGDNVDPVTGKGTEGDGRFQEGEILLDHGHRLWMHPRVAAPFQAGRFVEVYPEVGWHQTLYGTDRQGFEERGFFTARVEASTRLRGSIGEWTHLVEPRLGWAYALTNQQGDNPLLVPRTALPQQRVRALDLDNYLRDDADRIPRVNVTTLGVTNRFIRDGGRRAADVTLLGLYDIISSDFTQLVADGRVKARWGLWGRLKLGYDPQDADFDESLVAVGWRHQSGLEAELRHRYLNHVPNTFEAFVNGNRWDDAENLDRVHQLRGEVRVPVTRQWSASYRGAYSFERNELFSSAATLEYFSLCGCWSAGLQASGDIVTGISVRLLYSIEGFGVTELPGNRGVLDGV